MPYLTRSVEDLIDEIQQDYDWLKTVHNNHFNDDHPVMQVKVQLCKTTGVWIKSRSGSKRCNPNEYSIPVPLKEFKTALGITNNRIHHTFNYPVVLTALQLFTKAGQRNSKLESLGIV